MKYEEYREKRRQDPEYRKVEKRLKPYLDLMDWLFNIKMWLRGKFIKERKKLNDI